MPFSIFEMNRKHIIGCGVGLGLALAVFNYSIAEWRYFDTEKLAIDTELRWSFVPPRTNNTSNVRLYLDKRFFFGNKIHSSMIQVDTKGGWYFNRYWTVHTALEQKGITDLDRTLVFYQLRVLFKDASREEIDRFVWKIVRATPARIHNHNKTIIIDYLQNEPEESTANGSTEGIKIQ